MHLIEDDVKAVQLTLNDPTATARMTSRASSHWIEKENADQKNFQKSFLSETTVYNVVQHIV